MHAFRALTDLQRRLMLVVIVCALAARMLVPVGWMPVEGANGLRLSLCSGMGPEQMAAMPGMAHEKAPAKQDAGHEQPCSGAITGLAMVQADAPPPIFPPASHAFAETARPLVSVGRGLAAPPPPPTGPPSLA